MVAMARQAVEDRGGVVGAGGLSSLGHFRGSHQHLSARSSLASSRRGSARWADDAPLARRSLTGRDSTRLSTHGAGVRLSVSQRKTMNNNMGFGIQPWLGSVSESHGYRRPTLTPSRLGLNVFYMMLVGVPLGLVLGVVGLLQIMTIVCASRGLVCLRVARFVLSPFHKVLLTGGEGESEDVEAQAGGSVSARAADEATPLSRPGEEAASGPGDKGRKVTPVGVVFLVLFAPIITAVLLPYAGLCWLLVVSSPTAIFLKEVWLMLMRVGMSGKGVEVEEEAVRHQRQKNRERGKKLQRLNKGGSVSSQTQQSQLAPEVFAVSEPHTSPEITVSLIAPAGLGFVKQTLYGVNILLVNMLVFVPANFFFYFVMDKHWSEDNSILVMVCGLISLVPLSYYIGHSVASIAAQSGFFVGAVLNATFGSLIELIIYFMALGKHLNSLVVSATTGALLACMLLLPGLSMLCGGLRFKEQRFNQKAGQVSAIMMFVAVSGLLMPSIFYNTYKSSLMACVGCKGTSTTEDGALNGSLNCDVCTFDNDNFDKDPLYTDSVRPMSHGVCALLFAAYFVGLLFALHTHTHVYAEEGEEEEEEDAVPMRPPPRARGASPEDERSMSAVEDSEYARTLDNTLKGTLAQNAVPSQQGTSVAGGEAHAEGHGDGGHGPAWSRRTCIVILVSATGCFAVCSESLLQGLDPSLAKLGVTEEFAGLTMIAIVPCIAEFVNAIGFAMADNIKLSLEIGNIAALQMALVQVPVLTLGSALLGHTSPIDGFVLLYPSLNVASIFIATIVLTYVLVDGTCNYFRGVGLIVIYIIMIVMFWYKPSKLVF
eukprot:Rhum_TRINITY_DN14328_c0_g1::Rhum_TRINITY_DN14328_c0_g1_i2::g.83143::m.83143/K07300/chaA, CAX; Ca2+:H+ antiporter